MSGVTSYTVMLSLNPKALYLSGLRACWGDLGFLSKGLGCAGLGLLCWQLKGRTGYRFRFVV